MLLCIMCTCIIMGMSGPMICNVVHIECGECPYIPKEKVPCVLCECLLCIYVYST